METRRGGRLRGRTSCLKATAFSRPGGTLVVRTQEFACEKINTRTRYRSRPPLWWRRRTGSLALSKICSLTHSVPTLLLQGVEPGVEATGGDQLVVAPFSGHPAFFEDQDLVHVPD